MNFLNDNLIEDLLDSLTDFEFCDVTIVAMDGEISANKTILAIRCPYFRSMFSTNNNFIESQSCRAKMPYTMAVLKKVIIYIYSGKMDLDNLVLRQLLDLLDLLNLLNLELALTSVEDQIIIDIKRGTFPLSHCLHGLGQSSQLGLKTVGETMLSY